MGDCCEPEGYDVTFSDRFARRLARRYRRRGLTRSSRAIVAFLTQRGIADATILEIGGGVGDLQVELLRQGAARATNLEISTSYEPEAIALLERSGLRDRVDRRLLDIAQAPDAVDGADVVVLHRVVCCYPDVQRLLTAAADHATRLLVFSHPPANMLSRIIFASENMLFRLRRTPFRTYVHDPDAMRTAAEHGRLRTAYRHDGMAWHIVGLAAPAA
jgi:2-polyprenyl-3-methyl-5-hydroxy-6-metoxy-1,4-benzoquinol methylase